jgi:hypothetical protein
MSWRFGEMPELRLSIVIFKQLVIWNRGSMSLVGFLCVSTMTYRMACLISIPTMLTFFHDDDSTFGFSIKKWTDVPDFDLIPSSPAETPQEQYKPIQDETAEYRNKTNPTSWYHFATLGWYVVDGPTLTSSGMLLNWCTLISPYDLVV